MKTLRISLNCDFSDKNLVSEFYKFFEESRNTLNFLKHNKRVFETCNAANRDSCYLPRLYRSVCPHFPLRIAKVVRLKKPSRAESLFESDEFRLIALFRDPRAVASSRAATFYKSDGLKGDEDAFCSDFLTSIDDAVELKRRFPRRVFILRYEDLALDPQSIASDLLSKLMLKLSIRQNDVVIFRLLGSPDGSIDNRVYRFSHEIRRRKTVSIRNPERFGGGGFRVARPNGPRRRGHRPKALLRIYRQIGLQNASFESR